MNELENLNTMELCVHYKVCRIKPCHAHCCEYLPKDYFVTDRPHGKWVFDKDYPKLGSPYGSYKCSECGMHTDDDVDKYCWFCGADMRKEGDKNET